eukprot:2705170-Alexandrium_andersonii.AAC.1
MRRLHIRPAARQECLQWPTSPSRQAPPSTYTSPLPALPPPGRWSRSLLLLPELLPPTPGRPCRTALG